MDSDGVMQPYPDLPRLAHKDVAFPLVKTDWRSGFKLNLCHVI